MSLTIEMSYNHSGIKDKYIHDVCDTCHFTDRMNTYKYAHIYKHNTCI